VIVCVESNFLVELGLLQEQHAPCEELLELAEAKRISLAIPGFGVIEPYIALQNKWNRRAGIHGQLQTELQQLARSAPYAKLVEDSAVVTSTLVSSGVEEKARLDAYVRRLLKVASVIELTSSGYVEALDLQDSRGLTPQDAVVYASVLQHLRAAGGEQSCFVTRNYKDFLTPDIEHDLKALNCAVLTAFADGLGYAQAGLP
jgi:predicted nucleic acid-binding protein